MEYLLAFEEWEASLSETDRRALDDAAAPDLDSHSRCPTGAAGDVADSSAASEWPEISSQVDRVEDQLKEMFGVSDEQAAGLVEFLKRAIERRAQFEKSRVIVALADVFLRQPNPRIYAGALAYASDLGVTFGMGSMRAWSKSQGCTAAAVSKVAKFWRRKLNLPQGHHLRAEALSQTYREAQKENHWRGRDAGKYFVSRESKNQPTTTNENTN
jgi:hypothetical protein